MMTLIAFTTYWVAVTLIAKLARVDRGCGCKRCRGVEEETPVHSNLDERLKELAL
jgi:hypothetical protein